MIDTEGRNPKDPGEDEPANDSGTGQPTDPPEEDDKDAGTREVDRDSEDSFPASDPPAW